MKKGLHGTSHDFFDNVSCLDALQWRFGLQPRSGITYGIVQYSICWCKSLIFVVFACVKYVIDFFDDVKDGL